MRRRESAPQFFDYQSKMGFTSTTKVDKKIFKKWQK